MPYCHNCGSKASKDASYCHACGQELLTEGKHKASSKTNKKRVVAQEYTCPNCNKDFALEDVSKEQLEEGFNTECPHCKKECEIEPEESSTLSDNKRGRIVERVVEREYHHEEPKKGGSGFLLFILIIVILGVLAFVVMGSGAFDDMTKGTGVAYVDPCEREFNQCNHGCGDGILNSICKEKCTYQYNRCRG